jgi:hypothetical protein
MTGRQWVGLTATAIGFILIALLVIGFADR